VGDEVSITVEENVGFPVGGRVEISVILGEGRAEGCDKGLNGCIVGCSVGCAALGWIVG